MRLDLIEKLSVLITGAFGLVAALAWNAAIQQIFKNFFGDANSIPAMLGYAVIVTIIAVAVTISIGKSAERAKARIHARAQAKKNKK